MVWLVLWCVRWAEEHRRHHHWREQANYWRQQQEGNNDLDEMRAMSLRATRRNLERDQVPVTAPDRRGKPIVLNDDYEWEREQKRKK